MRHVTWLAAFLALSGCKLIDQTTFAPEPEAPPSAAQIAASSQQYGRTPLLTIRYTTPHPNYADVLEYAIRTAEQRRPNIEYDVVAVAPGTGAPSEQVKALQQTQQDALGVMRSIMELGVPDTRIHLGARTDPAATAREVRVYVR